MRCYTVLAVVLVASGWALGASPNVHYSRWSYEEIDSEEFGQARGPRGTSCPCGTTFKTAGRIVNGKLAKQNQFPHMVAIVNIYSGGSFSQFCGGTILTPRHIITAAHCTHGNDLPMGVIVGGHSLRNPTKYTKLYKVKEIREHSRYDENKVLNDIAILVLDTPIQYNEAVGPACLPTGPMKDAEYVKVTGWGDTSFNGQSSDTLRKVNLRVVPLTQCQKENRDVVLTNPHQICTYSHDKDSCQGDSGGPVTWLDPETNRYTLIGLVSYGIGCATYKPGVNTDVWAFRDWIQAVIRDTAPAKTCNKV